MEADTTNPVTIEEFLEIADREQNCKHELHHGRVVRIPFPKHLQFMARHRLLDLLGRALDSGRLYPSFPFRASDEPDLRAAGIGWLSPERVAQWNREDYLQGVPDLVIEVISAADTAEEMLDRQTVCFENGCREFWIVDPETKRVQVTALDRPLKTYRSGQQIPIAVAPGCAIAVDDFLSEEALWKQ